MPLTPTQEQQVMTMVERGLSYAAAAREIKVSASIVEKAMTKLRKESGAKLKPAVVVYSNGSPEPAQLKLSKHAIKRTKEAANAVKHAVGNLGDNDCRWPIGDPGTPDFRFCCQPKLLGKSYCAQHLRAGVNYVRPVSNSEMKALEKLANPPQLKTVR